MWNTSLLNEECQTSVADMLVAALRSVLSEAEVLRGAICEHPVIEPGTENDEILEKLAEFRRRVKEIERREAVLITRVTQARTWAKNLRQMAPDLRPEIDMFRLATAHCSTLQEAWAPSPYSLFNGGKRPQNSVDRRYGKVRPADGGDRVAGYDVCGKVAVSSIVLACETLLDRLTAAYSHDSLALPEEVDTLASGRRLAIEDFTPSGTAILLEPLPEAEHLSEAELTREVLDSTETAKGIETLAGLGMRAQETMRLAREVQARVVAETEELPDETPTPAIKPAPGQFMRRLSVAPLDLSEEILVPLDADDFFAGVPGVELGYI
jgi:hypothetical protein